MTFGGANCEKATEPCVGFAKIRKRPYWMPPELSWPHRRASKIENPFCNSFVRLVERSSDPRRQPDRAALGNDPQKRRIQRLLDHLHALHAIVDTLQKERTNRAEEEAAEKRETEIYRNVRLRGLCWNPPWIDHGHVR